MAYLKNIQKHQSWSAWSVFFFYLNLEINKFRIWKFYNQEQDSTPRLDFVNLSKCVVLTLVSPLYEKSDFLFHWSTWSDSAIQSYMERQVLYNILSSPCQLERILWNTKTAWNSCKYGIS